MHASALSADYFMRREYHQMLFTCVDACISYMIIDINPDNHVPTAMGSKTIGPF